MFANKLKSLSSLCVIAGCLMLSGCSQKYEITNRELVQKTPLNLPSPEALTLNNISYVIITKDNNIQVFKDNEVFYALSVQDYQDLALNLAKIKKYLIEQQQIIKSYKEYYENSEQK